ncbi:hypothetical protein Kpol_1031p49, partial [Vanderwaltozyma polyspora DSM 70294]
MDFKSSYSNVSLSPIYASTGAVATISEDGSILATPVVDEINIVALEDNAGNGTLLTTVENDDEQD